MNDVVNLEFRREKILGFFVTDLSQIGNKVVFVVSKKKP